jgi:hypothetical protein
MQYIKRLFWVTVLVCVSACRGGGGLKRVEVRGRATYQGAPIERGLITFRPAKGSKGPAAGTAIVDGRFLISAEQGPVAGPAEVDVKIVSLDNDLVKSGEPALVRRGTGQLQSFSERVEIAEGGNDFEFSFAGGQSVTAKREAP